MTLVDGTIVTLTLGAIGYFWHRSVQTAGMRLVLGGIALTGLFSLADLATMWLLPLFIGAAASIQWLEVLRLEVRWIVSLLSMGAIVAGFLLMQRNDRRQAQATVSGSEDLSSLIDALPDGLLIVDAAGTVVRANRESHRMFDTPDHSTVGRSISNLFVEIEDNTPFSGGRLGAISGSGARFPAEVNVTALRVVHP